jgi:hypothetical protein
MSFIIRDNEMSPEVRKIIYKKQIELKAEAKHQVSLGKTIERLLKDAYLKEGKK